MLPLTLTALQKQYQIFDLFLDFQRLLFVVWIYPWYSVDCKSKVMQYLVSPIIAYTSLWQRVKTAVYFNVNRFLNNEIKKITSYRNFLLVRYAIVF